MKPFKAILGAFIGSAKCDQSELIEPIRYEVTGCNNAESKAPELSLRVSESFFATNIGTDDSFTFADGFYTKSIPQDQLEVSFPSEEHLALTYTMELLSDSVALNADQTMVFNSGGSLSFQCTYGRIVSASSSITVVNPDDGTAATGEGELSYEMTVNMGELGGVTNVSITPNHSLNVYPRLTNCKIESGDFEVYPVHSFQDGVTCFDQTRLNFQQTSSNPDISFELRSFRFNDPNGSPEDEQNQLFTCSLYIDVADNQQAIEQETVNDCSCYSEEECSGVSITTNDIRYTGLTVYPEYEVSIDLNLDGSCDDVWCNVFGFGIDGLSSHALGGRVPAAVWLNPSTTTLHICRTNTVGHLCWDSGEMQTGTWFNLKITQTFNGAELLYKAFIDDVEIHQAVVAGIPANFENVAGVIGRSYLNHEDENYSPAPGRYRNFQFTSEP
jgi:hypothetical protein